MFTKSAEFYDAIYLGRGKDYQQESEKIHVFIQQHKRSSGNKLLDVGCGTGLHLAHLKRLYKVEGLDLDAEILNEARRRHPEIKFHQTDMANFKIDHEFDVIISLFSAIGYVKTIERLNQTIRIMSEHLNPGGVILIEPWFPPGVFTSGTVHATFIDEPNLKIARMNVGRIEGIVSYLDFHYLVATPQGVEHFTEIHELGLFTHEEYMHAFSAAGLQVTHDAQGIYDRGLYIGKKGI